MISTAEVTRMVCYSLKGHACTNDYMMIMSELDEGYVVKIVRDKDGYEDITTDFISRDLFESCVRTGYITKLEISAVTAVTA